MSRWAAKMAWNRGRQIFVTHPHRSPSRSLELIEILAGTSSQYLTGEETSKSHFGPLMAFISQKPGTPTHSAALENHLWFSRKRDILRFIAVLRIKLLKTWENEK